jgi:hypothetical protein
VTEENPSRMVFEVFRMIRFVTGAQIPIPLGIAKSESEADEMVARDQAFLSHYVDTEKFPQAGDASRILASLGIVAFGHGAHQLADPDNRIALPGPGVRIVKH